MSEKGCLLAYLIHALDIANLDLSINSCSSPGPSQDYQLSLLLEEAFACVPGLVATWAGFR